MIRRSVMGGEIKGKWRDETIVPVNLDKKFARQTGGDLYDA